MKCQKCGFRYDGNFCPHCGTPSVEQRGPDLENFDDTTQTRKSKAHIIFYCIAALLIVAGFLMLFREEYVLGIICLVLGGVSAILAFQQEDKADRAPQNRKLTRCKSCGAEVSKSATACPRCGARQTSQTTKAAIISVAVVIVAVIAVRAYFFYAGLRATQKAIDEIQSYDFFQPESQNNAPLNAQNIPNNTIQDQKAGKGTTDNQPDPVSTSDSVYGKGDTAESDGVSVTLVNVWENSGKQFFEPSEGNIFVICEFEIENNSDKELHISSLVDFDIYVDDYSADWSFSAESSVDKQSLDGPIAAGKKMSGVIGVEAPSSWSNVEVHFTPSLFSKEMVFAYSKWDAG